MKKLILSAAAFTMLFASCSKDEATVAGADALVTFNVATEQIASRVAYGDGVTTNDLEYAIYEKGSYSQPLIVKSIDDAYADIANTVMFSEKLVKGKTYIALFWADAKEDPYTINWNTQTVSITDPAALVAQDENLDAFFGCHEIVVGQTAQEERVELRRPFAQLNIGTSDTADAATAGLVVEKTSIAVRAYTSLNLLNGEVADATTLNYDLAAVPAGENATFTVKEKTYDRLSMNYLLVNAKELVEVAFTVNDGTKNINTSTFAPVPVQRNYKTFIVGELLTSAANFEVVILPDWANTEYVFPDDESDNEGEGGDDNTGDNEGEGGDDNTGDNEGEGGDDNTGDDEGDDQPTIIDWDYVCGAYQVAEWSSPYWNTTASQRYSKLGHGFWYNYVKLASECKDGDKLANPKDGQRYGLVYSWSNHIFFDISSTEIDPVTYEPKKGTGCYQIINMIDRSKDTDHLENNYSYYDKNEEAFYITFTVTSSGTVYRHDGKMHSRGSVAIKEP